MDSNILEEAFKGIFPGQDYTYRSEIRYNNKLKGYRANIYLKDKLICMNMNSRWKDVDDDIKIGLAQHLLVKLFRNRFVNCVKPQTINMDLYDKFIKKLHLIIEKDCIDPFLEESFDRVNKKYFYGTIIKPNLRFGKYSTRTLGSYSYTTDTITISAIFRDCPEDKLELLDYVMYHEMLHKKIKFRTTNNRTLYHSKRFREKEKEFRDSEKIEKMLAVFASKKRLADPVRKCSGKRRMLRWF